MWLGVCPLRQWGGEQGAWSGELGWAGLLVERSTWVAWGEMVALAVEGGVGKWEVCMKEKGISAMLWSNNDIGGVHVACQTDFKVVRNRFGACTLVRNWFRPNSPHVN